MQQKQSFWKIENKIKRIKKKWVKRKRKGTFFYIIKLTIHANTDWQTLLFAN